MKKCNAWKFPRGFGAGCEECGKPRYEHDMLWEPVSAFTGRVVPWTPAQIDEWLSLGHIDVARRNYLKSLGIQ